MADQEYYMKEAIKQARKAASIGEVPIGCVIVYEDKIIARGYNRRTTDKNTLAHAELQAIKKSQPKAGGLEAGGVHHVCDAGTLPDVRGSAGSGKDHGSGDRLHESEGGVRRIDSESSGNAGIQSSGQGGPRSQRGRMLADLKGFF